VVVGPPPPSVTVVVVLAPGSLVPVEDVEVVELPEETVLASSPQAAMRPTTASGAIRRAIRRMAGETSGTAGGFPLRLPWSGTIPHDPRAARDTLHR
jgi:hypothetical protein